MDLDVLSPPGSEGLLGAAPQGAQASGRCRANRGWHSASATPRPSSAPTSGALGSLLGSLGGEGSSSGKSSGLVSGGLGSLVKTLLSPLELMAADTPKARAEYAQLDGPDGRVRLGGGAARTAGRGGDRVHRRRPLDRRRRQARGPTRGQRRHRPGRHHPRHRRGGLGQPDGAAAAGGDRLGARLDRPAGVRPRPRRELGHGGPQPQLHDVGRRTGDRGRARAGRRHPAVADRRRADAGVGLRRSGADRIRQLDPDRLPDAATTVSGGARELGGGVSG